MRTEEYKQRIRLSLLNVKAYCKKTSKNFLTYMGRKDKSGNGLVSRADFTQLMRDALPDNFNEINMLANYYCLPYSIMIDYRKLNDDLLRLDDSSTASSNAVIKQFIWNHKVAIKQTLKGVFDANSKQGIMSFKEFNDLLIKCGFTSPNREFLEGFIKTFSHQHGNNLSFFDLLSAFDSKTIETEIALLLRRHEQTWLNLKKAVQTTYNSTICNKYIDCSLISTLNQELEKLPGMPDKKIDIIELTRVFADPILGNDKLDRNALKLAEETVNASSFAMFAPQQKPDPSTMIVPGSTLTFKKLKSLQKYVQSLDEDCHLNSNKSLEAFCAVYDPKKTNKISVGDFL